MSFEIKVICAIFTIGLLWSLTEVIIFYISCKKEHKNDNNATNEHEG